VPPRRHDLLAKIETEQGKDGRWHGHLIITCALPEDEVVYTSPLFDTEEEAVRDVRDGYADLVRMSMSENFGQVARGADAGRHDHSDDDGQHEH